MRTLDQINEIQEYETPPEVLQGVVSKEQIKFLLDYYNKSDNIIEKNTGPKVLYVKEGNGIIDDIVFDLRIKYGDFTIRSAHFFDVNKPHIIHNDDEKEFPLVYKAFTIPLWCEGNDKDIGLVMYDQFYYHGPAKFVNGETQDAPIHYNEFVREYSNVHYTSMDKIKNKTSLSHLRESWLTGLSVHSIMPWTIGNILSFESLRLHSSTDFVSKGIPRKIGLSIFTVK